MNIQIGLPCEPAWICDLIGWAVAAVVVMLIFGLIRSIRREIAKNKHRSKK